MFRHPNADGRLFRISGSIANNYQLEVARVPNAGNLIPLDEGLDAEEAKQFAESCEEFARAWCEDWRPYWLVKRMARLLASEPCASVKVTSESDETCKEIETDLFDFCIPCAARQWLAEYANDPRVPDSSSVST